MLKSLLKMALPQSAVAPRRNRKSRRDATGPPYSEADNATDLQGDGSQMGCLVRIPRMGRSNGTGGHLRTEGQAAVEPGGCAAFADHAVAARRRRCGHRNPEQ